MTVRLLLALLCALPLTAQAERSVQSSPEQLKALQQRMEALRDELNQSESAHREARDELRSSEKAISDATRALRDISRQRKEVETALTRTRADIATGETTLQRQQAQLAQLLRGHQRAGEADALRHLLSGTDPNQSARDLHYLRSLSRSQLALMDTHRATLAQQRERLAQQDSQLEQVRALEAERERERERLAAENNVRRKVLERLATQLRTERRELATLKRDAARLGRLIEALSKKSARTVPRPAPGGPPPADDPEPARNKADTGPVVQSLPVDHGGQPFAKLRGKLPWPASGELARRFGAQSADGGTPLRGIFIRAGAGDVKAVAAGTVVFADWLRGFGNLIIVDHGDHYLSIYGNNEALLKGVGARVGSGENIASIGSSGGALESGLYFELRHQGQALDPLKWVSRQISGRYTRGVLSMQKKLQQTGLIMIGLCAGVLLSLNFSANANKTPGSSLPVEELRQFADVLNAVKASYVEPVDDKKLITQAISGMLSGLDPHSAYLDQDAFKDLQAGTQGEFGGLGIEVGMEDGFVKVVSPIEDTPAFRAGIKSGDLIIKLDDTSTKGLNLSDAVKRMRGKPNTSIRLTIARKGETKPIEVTLMREVIKVQSVKSKLVEPGYGYLRLTQFQEQSAEDLAKHIGKLYKDGELKGLVLDLRNDPGGLLHGAVGVSAAFLQPKALVVSTDGRTDDAKRRFIASPEDYLRGSRDDFLQSLPAGAKSVPLVVLVNSGSASASEIVAGALQDHKRAVIMGTQTFGKGSVQTIMPLTNNTAIKLTTARYYTPNGRSIQAKGIVPDIVVEESANGSSGIRLREADLDRHLNNDKEAEAPAVPADAGAKGKAAPAKDEDDDKQAAPFEFATKTDYQFTQALNLLKGLQIMQKN